MCARVFYHLSALLVVSFTCNSSTVSFTHTRVYSAVVRSEDVTDLQLVSEGGGAGERAERSDSLSED